MNTDLMIDLETLGTEPDAPIISLGAQYFDPTTKQLGPTFYMILDISQQIKDGRKPSGSTLQWWMGQQDGAKRVFHEKAKPVQEVLTTFIQWHKAVNSKAYVWGNGSTFDISLMEDIFRQYNLPVPWGYNKVMDLRTFKRFQAKGASVLVKSGVAHNALDDARAQAEYVIQHS